MKAFLMYKDRDFNPKQPLPENTESLVQDLELNTLFNAMAEGDKFIFEIVKTAVLSGLHSQDEIRYRQAVLKDCVNNQQVIRELYQIPQESINNKHKRWLGIFTHSPAGVLSSSNDLMRMFVGLLKNLRRIADENAARFESEGFKSFFALIEKELDDEYFALIEYHLKQLKFQDGVLISAGLGKGNEGANYMLRLPNTKNRSWIKEVVLKRTPVYTFFISPRDDAGARAVSEIRDQGINVAANALAQSAQHIDSYLNMLRNELAFYIGCINLNNKLAEMGNPTCLPDPEIASERWHAVRELYDISLALTMKKKIIGNEINMDQRSLTVITGANQGGKSTFLRSIGLAQLMMQAGMFVPAEYFRANLCKGVFTHYKRKEDTTMKSGKLDEELGRMSVIVDQVSPDSLILFNESFAATNEREGSEIARQITTALLDKNVKVFFVTHMYEFAHTMFQKHPKDAIFLRAERKSGGRRTYKLFEGEPMQTSFGMDIYQLVFNQGAKT